MRNLKLTLIALVLSLTTLAQKQKLAVISFDTKADPFKTQNITELIRIEISKHNSYEMIDRYEIDEALHKAKIEPKTCFSKTCLSQAGEILKADFIVSGNADKMGESLFLRLRILDLNSDAIQKEVVKEFRYIPIKINEMITICVNEMLGIPNDPLIEKNLSSKESFESAANNPDYERLELSGPRMGYTFFTGEAAKLLKKPKSEGGYDVFPALFQMGYQFEKQYLNEGIWQGLFEFIPMITGVDQGLIIPSLTIMNGIRSNKTGLEFAIGPTLTLIKMNKMFKENGEWHRTLDLENENNKPLELRADSRGFPRLRSHVVLAAGYTIRSGKMNLPINAYAIPSKEGTRFGVSIGFNARKEKK